MSGAAKGWCPGAWRPMQSGDGLVVRVRPHGGRLTAAQAVALADLAVAHGNGLIDLTARAHLQLRGVREAGLAALQPELAALGLLDPDAATEMRRNIVTTPIWTEGDDTAALIAELEAALADGPDLPAKFGFAVDCGAASVLGGASADIRIERAADGLILRADGMALGQPVTPADAVAQAMVLAHWFADHAGDGRMRRRIAAGISPPLAASTPPLTGAPPVPGATPYGAYRALPFGQITPAALRHLAIGPLRLTPWRSVIVEGVAALAPHPDLIDDAADPVLRVVACTGAPGCAAASVATRQLARDMAPLVPPGALLHVSGCAKGCAHPRPARLTLTGRAGAYDLIARGRPDAAPLLRGLAPDDIAAILRGHFAPPI